MRLLRAVSTAAALLACACTVNVPPPKLPGPAPPAAEEARAAWARVLSTRVDERGRIDFAGLATDGGDLDTYVAWIGAVGPRSSPESFPTREAALAWYLNAYNALAMYNVLQSGIPKSLLDLKVRFFYWSKLSVGGRRMSLYALENEVIRPLGEPRVHFALNCMVRGCPRLPREPFAAEYLDAQLEAAAKEFLNEKRNVELFPPRRVARLSMILNWYEKDFLTKAPNLAAYVDRYRAEPIPPEYQIEFIAYDWTVNKQ